MCPPSYHHNGFVATYALGHVMYGYTLLIAMNQSVLNKLSKEDNISGHKWYTSVSWIIYDHLYYAPCLACSSLFSSLVPAMYNCI